ncbi:Hpt domain-containing protein [Vibrio sp. SS-MA-C1-2]|uniref:Hpt domain-containing protein n=1 Tax=Vibrio sp. SS-MA-C1-2 TaxID=2908646 RepID=UPI001F3C3A9B|nr:Hpt domain-containing protein [Vibrio sp. SS-MA-C1-2]UJF18141.1 Hpt domain-containing protein [Vibrio sp. SS-MA-C1-2]
MLDLSLLNEQFDSDQEMINSLFEIYIDEYGEYYEEILTLYRNQDISGLHSMSHSLKSMLNSFGVTDVAKKLETIEMMTHNQQLPEEALMIEVSSSIQSVNKEISIHLAS